MTWYVVWDLLLSRALFAKFSSVGQSEKPDNTFLFLFLFFVLCPVDELAVEVLRSRSTLSEVILKKSNTD